MSCLNAVIFRAALSGGRSIKFLFRRIAMQETTQEVYNDLVSLLKDQLARKDERIAMLEAQIEEANRLAGHPLSEEGAQADGAWDAPNRAEISPSPTPLRLPDFGPPNTVIARRVMEAAHSPVTLPEQEEVWESTARLEKKYLQQGHRALQAQASPRRRRRNALLGIGALTAGVCALLPFTLHRTPAGVSPQTVEPPVRMPSPPPRLEPMAAALPPRILTPPAVSAPEPTERPAVSPIAILPAAPKPAAPQAEPQMRAVPPPTPIRQATAGIPPSPAHRPRSMPPASSVPKRIAHRDKPHSPSVSASPLRAPPQKEDRERAADDPYAHPSPPDQAAKSERGSEDLPVPDPSSRYGI
jgi:hypothetical protein